MSNKNDLVRTVEECWRALRGEVEGIELSMPVYPDPLWRVRDVLLHCALWNDESVKSIEAHLQSGSYQTDTGTESFAEALDAMNGRVIEALRSVPEDEVRQRWVAAQDRVTEAVRSLDNDAMAREMTAPWHKRMPVEQMVREELVHEQEHIVDVLSAIASTETPE